MAEAEDSQQLVSADDEACDVNRDEACDVNRDEENDVNRDEERDVNRDAERKFVKEVLRRTRIQIKKDLKPDAVLDVFIECKFFGEHTDVKVRDIKEQLTTTEKNDQIVDASARTSQKYIKFKTSLVRTGQDELLGCIERMEITVHEGRGKNGDHSCAAVNQCTLLARLRCRDNKELYLPRKVLDLRKVLLSSYEGTFMRIAIFPEKTLDLEELYVEQQFKLIDHERKTEENGKSDEKTSIASVADIFNTDGKMCKNILVSAEPGLGKSTFCKHLVKLWYQSYTRDEATLTQDQITLKGFNLLFYIDLSEASISTKAPKYDEIAELLRDHLELTNSIEDISNILSDPSVLVVMDSLDELGSSRCPRRGIRNKSCIVTTSRPWKIEALSSKLIKDVDQHIEIVGLIDTSPLSLANNVLKVLNTDSDDMQTKTGYEFIQAITTKQLQHFLNVPLLLIQMLGLWFSGESFGNSQFEIYNKVIHHQILTADESKELPIYCTTKSKRMFPCCNSSDQCPCRYYGDLLWKLANMAYLTLFSQNMKMCLIFDHTVTSMYELSTVEVELCLKIGILTQHRLFVKNPNERKKNVSFPHKTYQEYFASIFLSDEGQQLNLDTVNSVVSDLDRALELDKVFLFCSEVNPGVARELSSIISKRADNNPSVQEYRRSYDRYHNAPHAKLIEKIQNIVIPATQQNTTLFLSDIIRYDKFSRYRSNPFVRQDHHRDVRNLDLPGVKSLHIESYPVCEADEMKTFELCHHLQKLVLYASGINVTNIHAMIERNRATLGTLGLGGTSYEPLAMLSLGSRFRKVLSHTINLSSVRLFFVILSHKQCNDLCTFVNASRNLRQLNLSEISCETHGNRKKAKCLVLDFRQNTYLHIVKLSNLPVEDVYINPQSLQKVEMCLPGMFPAQTSVISQLKAAGNLQELTWWRIDDPSSVLLLVETLSHLHSVQRIELRYVNFSDLGDFSLSASMEKLEYVELSYCNITCACLRCLINSLPNHKVMVELTGVTVTNDDNIFQDIRKSSSTNVTTEDCVEKKGDGWYAWNFTFDNNYTGLGQD